MTEPTSDNNKCTSASSDKPAGEEWVAPKMLANNNKFNVYVSLFHECMHSAPDVPPLYYISDNTTQICVIQSPL